MDSRHPLIRDAAAFLAARGTRPRAIVVAGDSGIGKTTFLDRLQVEVLAAGQFDIVVVDDVQAASDDERAVIRERIESDVRRALIVAHDGSDDDFLRWIDRVCERRVIELAPLAVAESRSMLAELGMQPWLLRTSQLLESAGGNPRSLVDGSFASLDLSRIPATDRSFDGDAWGAGLARRLDLTFHSDEASLAAFVGELRERSASGTATADDLATLTEVLLVEHELEAAIQAGELLASMDEAPERLRIIGAANASGARAVRGEPTAMLSLHALAGRASRAQLPLVEGFVWYLIGWCAGVLGDVATSERAVVRSIQLFDESDAVVLGLRARVMLAELHLAAGRGGAAVAYLEEVGVVATARSLHRLRVTAATGETRALLLDGHVDEAARRADETLELVLQVHVSRMDLVNTSVVAARAHAAAGSVDLAIAPLEALAADLGDSHSPDFWLVLEAVRVLGKAGNDPAAFQAWLARMNEFDADGHGGALRAAHAEADAWRAAIEGRKAEAARLAERARQLWVAAECHDELPLTEPIIQQAPLEHGPRISLVGSASGAVSAPVEDPAAFEALTKREREIARYVAGGLTNPEIASELHLSPRTVEHHVASILRKLELPSRRALVRGQV